MQASHNGNYCVKFNCMNTLYDYLVFLPCIACKLSDINNTYNEWVASGTNFDCVLQCTVCPLGEKHFHHSYIWSNAGSCSLLAKLDRQLSVL